MPRSDFRMQRLYIDADLDRDGRIEPSREQANYLLNVLRLEAGDAILVFNGRDGEWRAEIAEVGRKTCTLVLTDRIRDQTPAADLVYLFAPLKMARLDYMVQKAVEMGAGTIRPVITRHTQVTRVNLERMQANVIEASEQCGILAVPAVKPPIDLVRLLETWEAIEPGRRLIFCDEGEESDNPLEALTKLGRGPLAVLIGPEGGFAEDERALLRGYAFVTPIPLGPRVLRADTAAVAALAVIQATIGDW
ncbi:MAG: 16S rRNA (uracil(1498)-N(3))-methyltransferase [Ancalomicrobiaceae bacterium]|nr:16S rRNA (uracil(1498)-N(3))-methyltransferase [Ancalomicrobiaceae bacterium]